MNILPVGLNLKYCPVLIVGAGHVAAVKLKMLLACRAKVTVVAPEVSESVKGLAAQKKIRLKIRRFVWTDFDGHRLVYACSDDLKLNRDIALKARKRGLLCNCASDPKASDFVSPAVYKKGSLLIAVSTSGKDPAGAVKVRNAIKKSFKKK